jgi:hypothetical protein
MFCNFLSAFQSRKWVMEHVVLKGFKLSFPIKGSHHSILAGCMASASFGMTVSCMLLCLVTLFLIYDTFSISLHWIDFLKVSLGRTYHCAMIIYHG